MRTSSLLLGTPVNKAADYVSGISKVIRSSIKYYLDPPGTMGQQGTEPGIWQNELWKWPVTEIRTSGFMARCMESLAFYSNFPDFIL
jgi:hypothetical protein